MPRKRKEVNPSRITNNPMRTKEPVFSVVNEISKELGTPLYSEHGTRFVFKKDGYYLEIIVGEQFVHLRSWIGKGLLLLQMDKFLSFCNRLQELSERFNLPLRLEIDLEDSTKNIFKVSPRLHQVPGYRSVDIGERAVGYFSADRAEYVAKFVSRTQSFFVKVREIIDEFRVYDKSFEIVEKLWEQAKSTTDKADKGRLLEQLLSLLIGQDENFDVVEKNVRTKSEEIDIVLENLGRTAFYSQLRSPLILLECKNWASKIAAKEIRDFAQKIQNRPRVLCSIGVLVTISKLTKAANEELVGYRGKDFLIAVLNAVDITTIINKKLHIGKFLKDKIRKAGLR